MAPTPVWVNYAERVLNYYLSHAIARGLVAFEDIADVLSSPEFALAIKRVRSTFGRKDVADVTAGDAIALVSVLNSLIPGMDKISPAQIKAFIDSLDVLNLDAEVRVVLGPKGKVLTVMLVPATHVENKSVMFAAVDPTLLRVLEILGELPEWEAILNTREADLIVSMLRMFHAQASMIKGDAAEVAKVIGSVLKFIAGQPIEELVLPKALVDLEDGFSRMRLLAMSADETEIHHIIVTKDKKNGLMTVLAFDAEGNVLDNKKVNMPANVEDRQVRPIKKSNNIFDVLAMDDSDDEE